MTPDHIPAVSDLLRSAQLFAGFPPSTLQALAAEFESVELKAGEVCFREGDAGDGLFLIMTGSIHIDLSGVPTHNTLELGPGETFGEISFLTGDRRSATVVARTDSKLLKLTKKALEHLGEHFPSLPAELADRIVARIKKVHLSSALRRSELFGSLDHTLLREVEAAMQLVSLAAGETLFRRGEPGDAAYLVISGRLAVEPGSGDERGFPYELKSGDTFGEAALLTGESRNAAVYATRDTQLARLNQEDFQRLLGTHPPLVSIFLGRKMVRVMQQSRAGETTRFREPTTIAMIAVTPGVDLKAFGAGLVQGLTKIGPTRFLDSSSVDMALGRTGAAQSENEAEGSARVTGWLNHLEDQFRYVVYQADKNESAWTRRCIRQADQILAVADARGTPEPGQMESKLLHTDSPTSRKEVALILVHDGAVEQPWGTDKWLLRRADWRHYHLRQDSDADFARLARVITGRGVGVVLGGGFARGIAHVGVLKALEDSGVPIDLLGGTSVGSGVAAMYALGLSYDRMIQELGRGTSAFRDFTLPVTSLNSGKRLARIWLDIIGEKQIEDLWKPYFSVSTSLNQAKIKVHRSGSLFRSALASARAPGIFPPIVWDDDLLVDGAILNNLPVDVMKGFSNRGITIAVDVSRSQQPQKTMDYGLSLSGTRALWLRLNPWSEPRHLPSIRNVLMRSIVLNSDSERRKMKELADLYLQPPLGGFRFNDFSRGREMAEVAYEYSMKMIEPWLSTSSFSWFN